MQGWLNSKTTRGTETTHFLAERLREHHPSDEIVLDSQSYYELMDFRKRICGDSPKGITDIIWSNSVPLPDFVLVNSTGTRLRFYIQEDALETLSEAPEGRDLAIGAVQTMDPVRENGFSVLSVRRGEDTARMSSTTYYMDGDPVPDNGISMDSLARELWVLWHGIQLALLHPKVKEVFARPKMQKDYTREKDETGKRRRVVRYVKRHVVNGDELRRTMREIHRTCQAWYVIGHWRHLKNGRTVYVHGHWRGELRELKQNIDKGRVRDLALQEAKP